MVPLAWKYSAAMLAERERIAQSGSLRERVQFDLEGRPPYACGVLAAADSACFAGVSRIVACEFGVAAGAGLLELARLAELVSSETGVEIEVVGFDNGVGLPEPRDFRDHPELWTGGDFAMGEPCGLLRNLSDNCRLILGDIAATVPQFMRTLSSEKPLGFASFDVDTYSSTVSSLEVYSGPATSYLPVGIAYFDDTHGGADRIGSLYRNVKAGQLLAIDEFNRRYANRAIDVIRTLRHRRPLALEQWLEQVFGVHILDHPFRTKPARTSPLTVDQHGSFKKMVWPL